MRRALILTLTAFSLLCLSVAVRAEGMPKDAYISVLLELNRTKPGQNPQFTLGKQILTARILDKNQRTIGKVEDIILTPDGKFETILTHIDATGFREQVAFDVGSYVIQPTPDTFTISMDKSQLKQNAEQLVAAIPTAAGENGPFSLSSIQKGEIVKADGGVIALVDNALIDTKASQVAALLVTISGGEHRGSKIAIPYEAAAAKLFDGKAILTVTDEQASVISSMATSR